MDSKNYTDKKYSLSDEGETPKQYGNFNTYAKDVILQRDTAHTSSKQTAKEIPSVNNKTEESTVQFSELTHSNHVSYKIFFITLAVVLIVILAIGTILSVEQRKEIMLSEAAYTELEKKYDVLNNKFVDLFKRNEELQKKYNKIIDEYEFYRHHAVCINENDPYYHNYSCTNFDKSHFLIFNIEQAKGEGFEPCPDCRLTE